MTDLAKYSNDVGKFQFRRLISSFCILKKSTEEKYGTYSGTQGIGVFKDIVIGHMINHTAETKIFANIQVDVECKFVVEMDEEWRFGKSFL